MSTAAIESLSDTESKLDTALHDPSFWEFAYQQFAEPAPTDVDMPIVIYDLRDLQADKVAEHKDTKAELLDVLMESPMEAFRQQVTDLAATCYQARMEHSGGSRFYTRRNTSPDSLTLDSMTTISDSEDGSMSIFRHQMFAPATYGYDNRVEIIATSEGDFFVCTEVYKNGITSLKDITDTSEANSILREYFTSSLRAAGAVKGRPVEENALADDDANLRYDRLQKLGYKNII